MKSVRLRGSFLDPKAQTFLSIRMKNKETLLYFGKRTNICASGIRFGAHKRIFS